MISVCVLTHMCGDCRVTLEIGSLYYGFQGSNSDVRFGSHSPSPTEPLLSSPELGFGFFSFFRIWSWVCLLFAKTSNLKSKLSYFQPSQAINELRVFFLFKLKLVEVTDSDIKIVLIIQLSICFTLNGIET